MNPFDNPINQKIYEDMLAGLAFHRLTCSCGHCGCLTIHGYYKRSLKLGDGAITLTICRVKCNHCLKTHALLPSQIVPYSQVSLEEQIAITSAYEHSHDYSEIMERVPSIDENLIAAILCRYKKHWSQKIRSFRLTPNPSESFLKVCFSLFMSTFMQIRQTPNILFLTPT